MASDGSCDLHSVGHGRRLWLGFDGRRKRRRRRLVRREFRGCRERRRRGGGSGQSTQRRWYRDGQSTRRRWGSRRRLGRHTRVGRRHQRHGRATAARQRRRVGRWIELSARVLREQHMCHVVWSDAERLRRCPPSRHGERPDLQRTTDAAPEGRLLRSAEVPAGSRRRFVRRDRCRRAMLRAVCPHRRVSARPEDCPTPMSTRHRSRRAAAPMSELARSTGDFSLIVRPRARIPSLVAGCSASAAARTGLLTAT
jgi:hypothetical protein